MTEETLKHIPVMLSEVIAAASDHLKGIENPVIFDGTLGEAGHATALMQLFPNAKYIAFDRDPQMIERAKRKLTGAQKDYSSESISDAQPDNRSESDRLADDNTGRSQNLLSRIEIINLPFSEGFELMKEQGRKADFILLDLGVSLFHFSGAQIGFSYNDANLDMRLSPDIKKDARRVITELSETELADIIYKYGEEKESRIIARKIKENLPIESAQALAKIIADSVYHKRKKGDRASGKSSIHSATRVFQALRIYVNDELGEIERAFKAIPDILNPGGMLAVISFHSLEDRIVKHTFREWTGPRQAKGNKYRPEKQHLAMADSPYKFQDWGENPILPTEEECRINPPSRSAKLRVILLTN
jgi:16S rRNA (cytosine1402-N4)-methyltransferase